MRMAEIQGTHMELTDAIKAYVDDKLSNIAKLTEKFEPCDVRVEVGKTGVGQQKGNIFRCELNLTIPGVVLRSEAIRDDLYASIDESTDELKRQVKRYKEKLRDADRVKIETTTSEHEEEY